MEDMTLKPNAQGEPTPEIADDFTWLMSLALDEMLDGPERTRFDAYVADYPTLASEWADWQHVDGALDAMPHMLPAPGFVARFETRLAHAEAKQQQRVMTFAFVVVGLALACFVAGALGTGAFVVSTQGPWLGEQIRNLVYAANIVDNWFGAFAGTLSSLVSSPQARALGFVYLAMVALVVGGWMQLLQRSTHLAEAAVVTGTE